MPCKSSKSSEMEGLHIERDVESSRESQNAKVLLWHWLNTRLYWQGSQIGMSVEYGPTLLLTWVSKWNSHPKISIVYCGNTFFLLCEQHFEVSINWVSNPWYTMEILGWEFHLETRVKRTSLKLAFKDS